MVALRPGRTARRGTPSSDPPHRSPPGQGRDGVAGPTCHDGRVAGEDDGGPERTPSGHHIVVKGRRWRAADPSIPEPLRAELVSALMAARRAVRTDDRSEERRVGKRDV